jgi:sugar/nucleoside kinase (ribokinase family)
LNFDFFPMQKKYALLSVGEILIDFIGSVKTDSLLQAVDFQRFQGGSPANLAANMARLGANVALVSTVGADNLGKFLKTEIAKTGIDISHIVDCETQPTSIVVVSRTSGTPDFVAYRTADRMLLPEHLPDTLLAESSIFHTTCFALSQEPSQSTIIEAASRAAKLGCQVSIDCNYAPSIWPDRKQAWQVIGKYCSSNAFVKLSEDDAERLYSYKVESEQIIYDFHEMGASLVCLTLGGDGAIISYNNGENLFRLGAQQVDVIDATGAGDAFWSGFLTAYLDGKTMPQSGQAGTKMAILKLTHLGPLSAKVDKNLLYS